MLNKINRSAWRKQSTRHIKIHMNFSVKNFILLNLKCANNNYCMSMRRTIQITLVFENLSCFFVVVEQIAIKSSQTEWSMCFNSSSIWVWDWVLNWFHLKWRDTKKKLKITNVWASDKKWDDDLHIFRSEALVVDLLVLIDDYTIRKPDKVKSNRFMAFIPYLCVHKKRQTHTFSTFKYVYTINCAWITFKCV